jgi:hypothetical protein
MLRETGRTGGTSTGRMTATASMGVCSLEGLQSQMAAVANSFGSRTSRRIMPAMTAFVFPPGGPSDSSLSRSLIELLSFSAVWHAYSPCAQQSISLNLPNEDVVSLANCSSVPHDLTIRLFAYACWSIVGRRFFTLDLVTRAAFCDFLSWPHGISLFAPSDCSFIFSPSNTSVMGCIRSSVGCLPSLSILHISVVPSSFFFCFPIIWRDWADTRVVSPGNHR